MEEETKDSLTTLIIPVLWFSLVIFTFCSLLETEFLATIPTFFAGNRYMSVLHARLRNNCSGLNTDFFRYHISNNPLCDLCNVAEDAYHYFFQCRKYSVERQVLNDTVIGFHPSNINVILYGNENWNTGENMVLFRAVQRYIHASKRF